MIEDGRLVPEGTQLKCDICVVGGGPAGLSLALRLASAAWLKVIVLESGGLEFDDQTQDLAGGKVSGLPYFPLHETRIRAFGGSSMSWGGVCTRFDDLAFEARPWVEDSGWPFPAMTLAPYADEALALCQVEPESRRRVDAATRERAAKSGLDQGRLVVRPVYFSPPTRFGSVYRARLGSAANISVLLNATATELHLDEQGKQIEGVTASCLTRSRFRVQATYYVLAAGGVENARLMLASNRVRPQGIGNETDVVGRYFMEHPRVQARYRVGCGSNALDPLIGDTAAGTLRFVRMALSPTVQRSERLLQFHASLQYGYAGQTSSQWEALRRLVIATRAPWKDSPYFHGAGGGRLKLRARDVLTVLRRPDVALISGLGAATRHARLRRFLHVSAEIEQAPDRNRRVQLSTERDALGVPRAHISWWATPAEERTYRRGMEILLDELERFEPGIKTSCIEEGDLWPSRMIGTWHHIGTTRMHDNPRFGVVDGQCRVHDVGNLFVAGSSVFPVSASTSPTVTIVQLSLRLADYLLQELEDSRHPSA